MEFLLGFYVAIAMITFLLTMFFTVLGGKEEDLYKPFLVAAFWPMYLVRYCMTGKSL